MVKTLPQRGKVHNAMFSKSRQGKTKPVSCLRVSCRLLLIRVLWLQSRGQIDRTGQGEQDGLPKAEL